MTSLAQSFFPSRPYLWNQLDLFNIVGGLVTFGLYMIYDNWHMAKKAEEQADNEFDPMNESSNMYLNVINFFLRVIRLLLRRESNKQRF